MTIAIAPLPAEQRHRLAPLLEDYAAEMRATLAGSRPARGVDAAALLATDARTEVLAAHEGEAILAFAIFFDLPEAVFARRCGALDDLFVRADRRGQGLARAMLDALCALGRERHWSHLRWIVPEGDRGAIALYERVATRADWRSYVIRLDPEASL
ncbi:GNAT family N-acetyltransferase [Roseomonas eburnea]|uniref:GNAT family N-acetyltransferase n=1 Tax=Neoroseomonas eburnea TaxID=1346889 RepID=A0A9X9XAI4_9PROT|nr:GNAT family N-acetyltransferase [Neoroseomonas eburnea]MBR0680720.1 GNAT family N-acetyltransferase [Neoroseomonas eburnea]